MARQECKDEYLLRKTVERFLEKYPNKQTMSDHVLAHGDVFDIEIKKREVGQLDAEDVWKRLY